MYLDKTRERLQFREIMNEGGGGCWVWVDPSAKYDVTFDKF